MSGTILPAADNTYSLGSSSLRWRDVNVGNILNVSYLTTNTAVVCNDAYDLVSMPYDATASALSLVLRDELGGGWFSGVTASNINAPDESDISINVPSNQVIKNQVNGSDVMTIDSEGALVAGDLTVDGVTYPTGGVEFVTSGGTPANLNAYETGSLSNNWGGAVSSTSGPISFSKVGKSVCISWAELSHLGNGSTTVIASTTGVIPSRMRPITDFERIAMIQNNGSWGVGHVRVLTSGTIQFFASNPSGNFNGSGQHYIPGECFSYPVS